MTLDSGARLGPYEILSPLGAGGMGVVWRARDTRLDRTVAIKALPDAFARDPERLARFEREAKLLASLSHPNIAAIYGLEDAGGQRHLILEYVEGDTLADRLRRGAMRVEEALDACRQIAAALESAHESGVIHRDLKPANVKITPTGEIKVLDFGLAKGGATESSAPSLLTQSPTMALGMTSAGVILGTAAYVSPEQARGRAVDRRTDIWSFGCVLYECLTGHQTFEGETVSDMIARILEREPDWSALPANLPASVHELLRRCLEKDAKQRLRDIGDARLTLERAIADRSSASRAVKPRGAGGASPLRIALAALGGIILGAVAWAVVGRNLPAPPGTAALTHLSITFPEDPEIRDFQVSPDARRLVCLGIPASERARGNAGARLYVRDLNEYALREIPGTEGVRAFLLTPDGRWIHFLGPINPGAQELRVARVPMDGNAPPVTFSRADPTWFGGTTLHGGGMLLADERVERMVRVSPQGQFSEPFAIDRGSFRGALGVMYEVLPGDRAVLVDLRVYREQGWVVQVGVLDLRTRKLSILIEEGGRPRLLDGRTLLFSRGDVLLAVPFDAAKLAVRGTPIAVESGLRSQFIYTPGVYDIDRAGNLYLVPGGTLASHRRLGIVTRDGKVQPMAAAPATFQDFPSPSASGREFTVKITNAQGIDEVWFGETERPAIRRVVSWPNADATSVMCSPSGMRVAYGRVGRDDLDGLYLADTHRIERAVDRSSGGAPGAAPRKQTFGVGRRIVVPESSSVMYRTEAWSVDEKYLVMTRIQNGTSDFWIARVPEGDSVAVPRPLLETPYEEYAADFSPDGKWMAWHSNASGRKEVYAAPFLPGGALGSVVQITDQGAQVPEWTGDGRGLVVRDLAERNITIHQVGMPPSPGEHAVREWFDAKSSGVLDFVVMADGRALAILRGERETERLESVNVMLGWGAALKKRLAAAH